jgi:hypothetical protein
MGQSIQLKNGGEATRRTNISVGYEWQTGDGLIVTTGAVSEGRTAKTVLRTE